MLSSIQKYNVLEALRTAVKQAKQGGYRISHHSFGINAGLGGKFTSPAHEVCPIGAYLLGKKRDTVRFSFVEEIGRHLGAGFIFFEGFWRGFDSYYSDLAQLRHQSACPFSEDDLRQGWESGYEFAVELNTQRSVLDANT